ncbi:MAG: 5'-nucleotidase C-terminal domain-containing protein, partial [Chloroflexi bacterium]|nr:5'-nucleotidase C-terminal domain-containing protein [Chloroflexota bacterium]
RASSGADIGFCNADQVIRATLPVGDVDINAIFRTGGHRGHEVIKANLKGEAIEAYLNALRRTDYPLTQWSGFRAFVPGENAASDIIKTDLDPDRLYNVIMPKKEWDTRLLRSFRKVIEQNIGAEIKVPQHVLTAIPTSTRP